MPHERLRDLLTNIYGPEAAGPALQALLSILEKYKGRIPSGRTEDLSERDALLITYADQVRSPGEPGLATLQSFSEAHLRGLVSGIHILPFYPWSSDDGFSVIDYEAVAPEYGTWGEIRRLGLGFRLMLDAVINHASARGTWFSGFLRGDPEYQDFFIEVHGNPDLSQVVRPRALPLLTELPDDGRVRRLWTTFSPDQVDLNYHNPRVLLRVLDVLLFYVSQGADFIRLDAIAYLWKEPGTTCISLPQTHWVVQLLRAVLDEVAPHVMLITETNVPNLENLSYFGDGTNEAQLVYNFPLPPLVLHAMQAGDASVLRKWAATLQLPSDRVTFLNFLASHDGIGFNPVRGILPESEIEAMAQRIEEGGGYISAKTNATGGQSPYEMNINYFDALNCGDASTDTRRQVQRFLAAHAILLAFQGMPAIYFHSLFGSRGWPEGVKATGRYRTINRQKLDRAELEGELANAASLRAHVFGGMAQLLKVRSAHPAFSPHTPQRLLEAPGHSLALLREMPDGEAVLCAHNVSGRPEALDLDLSDSSFAGLPQLVDLISGRAVQGGGRIRLQMGAYQVAWLTAG